MAEKWVGKIAIVTGSSSGIGAAVFKDLVEAGLVVVGLDIEIRNTEEVIQNYSNQNKTAFAYTCNVADHASVKETFKKIEEKFNFVNMIVNCAGIGRKADILDCVDESMELMNQVIDTNFRGVIYCTREAFRLMKKSDDNGLIININSITGHKTPIMDVSLNVYGPTKYAVTAFNESVRLELYRAGNKKIRISSISPGIVDSNFIRASGYASAGPNENMFDEIPKLKPKDVSSAVLFILSTPYDVNVSDLLLRSTGERD